MSRLIQEYDWKGTPLGNAETWPASLQITLGIVLNSPFPMLLFWGEELICFYNDAFRPSLGNEGRHPGILGKKGEEAWADIWHYVGSMIREVFQTGAATSFEDHLVPIFRNGRMENVYWTFSYSPVRDEAGTIGGVLVVCTETSRKVTKFHNLVEQVKTPVVIYKGEDLVIEEANQAALDIWKVGKEVLGRPFLEAIPEMREQGFAELLLNVYHTGEKAYGFESPAQFARREGGETETIYFNYEFSPYREASGEISGVMVLASDVTQQVVARQQLAVAEDEMRTAMNAADLGYWNLDPSTNQLKCNDRTRELFGLPPDQDVDLKLAIDAIHEQDRDKMLQAIQATLQPESGGHLDIEYRVINPLTNQEHYIRAIGQAYFKEKGQVYRFSGTVQDTSKETKAQRALAQSEEQLRIATLAANVGIWNYDLVSNTVYASDIWKMLFGLAPDEELTYDAFINAVVEEERAQVHQANQDVIGLKNGISDYALEFRVKRKNDGAVRWLKARGKVYTNKEKKPVSFAGAVTDITREKEAEVHLIYRKALLEAQNNAIPDGVLIVDTKGKMLSFNRQFTEIWKIPQPVIDARDDQGALAFAMTQVVNPQAFIDRVNYLYQHTHEAAKEEVALKDGRILERNGNIVLGEDGTYFGWAWYFRDITEQKRAAEALRQSNERFELVSTATQDAIWDWNLETNDIWWNEEFKTLFGYKQEEIEPGIESWYNRVHPEDKDRVIGGIHKVIDSGGKTWSDEYRFRKADGTYAVVLDRGYALHDGDGKPIRMLGSMQDVTQRHLFETTLQESEQRFRGTFENAAVGMAHVALDGRWLMVNQRICNIVGYTQNELLSATFQDITHPEDLGSDLNLLQQTLNGTINRYSLDKRYIHKNGSTIWINLTVSLVRNKAGEPQYFISIVKDISERKHAEAALKQSEEKYRSLFQTMDQGFCIIEVLFDAQDEGVDYRFLEYNKRFTEQCGLENAVGKTIRELVPGIEDHWPQTYGRVARTGEAIRFTQQSEVMGRWFEVYAYKTGDQSGNHVAILFTDITARKKTEEVIKQSEERFRSLANAMPQLVWVAEPNGDITYYNDYVAHFEGAVKREDGTWAWEGLLHPDDVEAAQAAWKEALASQITYEKELRVRLKSAGFRWYLSRAIPQYKEYGQVVKWYGTTTDIHEQKIFSENLEKLVAERTGALQRSNEDLQQFAHVASHDLKEPVRKIRTFSGRLKDEFAAQLPEKAALYLTKIEKGADRMYDMIDGVLLYSSLEAMRQTTEEVDLNDILQNIQSDLELVIAQKQAIITIEAIPAVEGMPILLQQLFYNLFNNSLKFAQTDVSPRITITSEQVRPGAAKALNLPAEKAFVQIRLQDNGIGFAQSEAERIFKTFSRLNSKDKYEGTGLGLALCKKIVERHGGKIWAEGKPGEGAVFTILLPSFNEYSL